MLSEVEIIAELNAITDNMAFDSDDGGDSDAEDYNVNSVNTNYSKPCIPTNNCPKQKVWRLSTRPSSFNSTETNDSIKDNMIYEPNISIIKPTEPTNYNLQQNFPSTSKDIHHNLKSLDDILSSSDEDIDDTFNDKDYIPIHLQHSDEHENDQLVDLDEETINNLPIDVDLFIGDDLDNNQVNLEIDNDNIVNANNCNEFNFVKSGFSPVKFNKCKFKEEQGPINKNICKMHPIYIFEIMIGPIFQKIVLDTNLYAQQNNANINTSIEEIKAFIGILIFMGYHSLPSMRLYWSNDPNFLMVYLHVEHLEPIKGFIQNSL